MEIFKSKRFENGYARLVKEDPCLVRKLEKIMAAVITSPRAGVGRPEQLKGYRPRVVWSRRIIGKHRLVYELGKNFIVYHSCYGHYDDH
ncbi:MAG: type II toxin-antitoxin system YoeB family toxin [Puniceicoccales bacterium]|jgi:toxin YoeB|nr:type II toxin-antitoxin system YoeB family toxin [Puniceicoccales bacterium]